MNPTIFDIETTGIDNFRTLEGLTKIHCLVLRRGTECTSYTGSEIPNGLQILHNADIIAGHNAIGFDIPAIQKLYPNWKPGGLVRDTLVLARLAFPDQKNSDYSISEYPRKLIGSHSLEAWGHRLGEHKGDYQGGWEELNDEMLAYCKQDTLVTQLLWDKIKTLELSPDSVALEHQFAECLIDQERYGFKFDLKAAVKLYTRLSETRDSLREKLEEAFPPVVEVMKTPAYWYVGDKKYPTKKSAAADGIKPKELSRGPLKTKTRPFNPDSRQQIAKCLIDKYNWQPKAYTDNGQPKVDESILKVLPHTEAKMLVVYLTLSKRLGQLGDGGESWMKLEENGRIYGRVNPNGAVTGRCTHSKPNVANVPACSVPYGEECRALFGVDPGYLLVGADASGLELRCLAHYLSKWDGGEYARIICDGDIHTKNMEAAGLEKRQDAKTFIYAYLYGSGPQRIGSIIGKGAKEGRILMNRFLKRIPALKFLKEHIDKTLKVRDYLVGLDGRRIPIRSSHAALNALLQSAGAVIMKQATVNANRLHRMDGVEAHQVAHIHDEIQYEVLEKDAQRAGELTVKAIRQAGKPFGFRCPLDGEYRVGQNWAETH